jgi:hypothetical protein
MREPGEEPLFNRIIEEVERARVEWGLGNRGRAEAILRAAASIAYAEARERGPNDPKPEAVRR